MTENPGRHRTPVSDCACARRHVPESIGPPDDVVSYLTTVAGGAMLRTLVIVILMTPAAALAQGRQEILLGQTLSGALGPDDRSRDGRPFDDFEYSAEPGSGLRVIVRSSS